MAGFGDHTEGEGRYQYQGQVNPNDPSLANGGITPEQWAEYQAKRRRDAILGVLGVLGGTSALGAVGAALGGGGAAGAAAGSAGAGSSLAPIAGGAPWAVTPYASAATMVPTGAAAAGGAIGAGAAGAGSGLAKALGGLSARDIAGLGLAGASTIGGALAGKNQSMQPNTTSGDPNIQALMQLMMGRIQKSEPLYDSVLNMANGLLPTQYQKGGGGMG